MTISPHDARHFRRTETSVRCWIEAGSTTLYARLGNISAGGVFVRTATPISQGTQLKLRWSLDEAAVELEAGATVVWVRPASPESPVPGGMGLRFEQMAGDQQRQIDAYVASQLLNA